MRDNLLVNERDRDVILLTNAVSTLDENIGTSEKFKVKQDIQVKIKLEYNEHTQKCRGAHSRWSLVLKAYWDLIPNLKSNWYMRSMGKDAGKCPVPDSVC